MTATQRIWKTDFSEQPLGDFPAGWTLRWPAQSGTISVVEDAGAIGGRILRIATGSGNAHRGISWDEPGQFTDGELLAKIRTGAGDLGVFLRRTDSPNQEYGATSRPGDSSTFRINRRVLGDFTQLAVTDGGVVLANVWYWLRFRVQGSDVRAKIWIDGVAEPAEWTLIASDGNVAGPGWAAVSGWFANTNHDFDFISVTHGSPLVVPDPNADVFFVSGTITDASGDPAERIVRAYDRSTGALMAETLSNATTGAYALSVPTTAEVQRIVLDSATGEPVHNDIIDRVIPG